MKNYWGKDISGQRFGRLILLERILNKFGKAMYLCRCDCGKTVSVYQCNLGRGNTTSCGCFHREKVSEGKYASNLIKTTEYKSWSGMKDRCYNENHKSYHLWGGMGVKVCDRWINSFENFLADMGKKPSPMHSLDRYPNKNGNYEPTNCRWATPKQQSNNLRSNVMITHNGETKNMSEWAEVLKISLKLLFYHYRVSKKKFSTIYDRFMAKGTHGLPLLSTAKKVGSFDGNKLVKIYSPIWSVKDDGFDRNSVRSAANKGKRYKGLTWKYLDKEPINELICQA